MIQINGYLLGLVYNLIKEQDIIYILYLYIDNIELIWNKLQLPIVQQTALLHVGHLGTIEWVINLFLIKMFMTLYNNL